MQQQQPISRARSQDPRQQNDEKVCRKTTILQKFKWLMKLRVEPISLFAKISLDNPVQDSKINSLKI